MMRIWITGRSGIQRPTPKARHMGFKFLAVYDVSERRETPVAFAEGENERDQFYKMVAKVRAPKPMPGAEIPRPRSSQ